jgi:hypothetical protein
MNKLNLPEYEANAQVEPEIAVLFDIIYNDDNKVTDLVAQKFTTFNDCTIRKEGAKKISEKKSWGINSKGIGNKWITIYFYTKLKMWLIDKMNTQEDFGPLEDIAAHLKACDYPEQTLISIGATAYAEFGEKNYLKSGDNVYVVAYDARMESSDFEASESKVILHQKVQ